jgi:hypothetical protein
MSELNIERLKLQITNASGHEHRVQSIAEQAAALIGEKLVAFGRGLPNATQEASVDALSPQPVSLDLLQMDNESCANAVADSVMNAIRLQIEG